MNRTDLTVASGFLALAVFLIAASFTLPAGMGALPGPGFFPRVIGVLVLLLAGGLAYQASRQQAREEQFAIENGRTLAGVIGLAFVYLALWGTGFFAFRTAVFLALFLKFLGQSWKASVTVALVLTVTVTLAFQTGLRVSLE